MSREEKIRIIWILIVQLIIVGIYGIITTVSYIQKNKQQNEVIEEIRILQSQNTQDILEIKGQIRTIEKHESDTGTLLETLKTEVEKIKYIEENIRKFEFNLEMQALEKIKDKEEWFIEYKRITDTYRDYIDPPETIYDVYSQEEITWLCRMIESETTGCPFECRVHVADVAFNRIEAEEWPDTLLNVITQSGQFSTKATNITETTRLAAEYAFLFPGSARGALSFHSNAKSDTFNGYGYIFSDTAVHHFYGKK